MPRNHFSYRMPLKIWNEVLTPKLILGRERCNESQILRFEICIETDQEIVNVVKQHINFV
jgi:hypothetical protein